MAHNYEHAEHDEATSSKKVTIVGGSLSGGQATVTPLQAWPDPKTYIGLVTITGSLAPAAGNITLDPGSRTGIIGNVTIQDGGGSLTVDGSVGVIGNVTLSDSKTFIGLTTTTLGASPAFIGIVTVTNASIAVTQSGTWDEVGINDSGNSITIDGNIGVLGNVTLSDSKGFIGLVTVVQGSTARSITGNITLSDSKTFIGLTTTTLGASPAFIGIVTVTNKDRTITGNLTLSDAKTFIGLVTAVPAYGSNSTVYTGVISSTGNTTVLVAPASNRFFIKNLHISSLGRSEVEIRSGATTLIPFTSLSTTAGYFEHYGEQGLPARAQTDALVINLNGAATISYMANVRFEA